LVLMGWALAEKVGRGGAQGAKDATSAVAECTPVIDAKDASAQDRAQARLFRASARQALGDGPGALQDMDIAVQLAPQDSMMFANRGAIRGQQGDLDAAMRDLQEALRLDPANALAIGNRAIIHSKRSEFGEALADVDRALAVDPKAAPMWAERCWIGAATAAHLPATLQDCNKALELLPDDANNFNSRGLANFRMGKFAEATADYDRSIAGNPNVASSFLMRGVVKRAAGVADAQADIDRGKAMDPTVAARYASYGVATD